MQEYQYKGAQALLQLHERYLRSFLQTWRRASAANIILPQTDDPNYRSLATLLYHVMRCSRNYMVWICEKLELPDPGIDPAPEPDVIEAQADDYLEHLLSRWRLPLANVPEDRFYDRAYKSRWDVEYCIDAMLEHAVMHPIRHDYQLIKLINKN
ncbi:MAG TPA: hypothetical protein PLP19_19315 [bacterium]|nr:hypothetical protein [bacterium]HPN45646.1 hypothetical protein [bacterium]